MDFMSNIFEGIVPDFSSENMDLLSSSMFECGIFEDLYEGTDDIKDLFSSDLTEMDVIQNLNYEPLISHEHNMLSQVLQQYDEQGNGDQLMYAIVNPRKNTPDSFLDPFIPCTNLQNLNTDYPNVVVEEAEANENISFANSNDEFQHAYLPDSSSDSGIEQQYTPSEVFSHGKTEKGIQSSSKGTATIIIWPQNISKKNSKVSLLKKQSVAKNSQSKSLSMKKEQIELPKLNREERRIYRQEGIKLPSKYPLTREDERNLKRIRRKVKNRESAQDSRQRKKIYITNLEAQVKAYSAEKCQLLKQVEQLKAQNKIFANLLKQPKKNLERGLSLD